jgi:hypothetical protein
LSVAELTADRTVTIPLLTGNDEVVFKDHTQTLTNKTINASQLVDKSITDAKIADNNITLAKMAIKQPLSYQMVNRRPIWGIGGDGYIDFGNSWVQVGNTNYGLLDGYGIPTLQSGASRKSRLYAVWSDGISDTSKNVVIWLDSNNGESYDISANMGYTWGTITDRRDGYSSFFTPPTGGGHYVVKIIINADYSGRLYYLELQTFDVFS